MSASAFHISFATIQLWHAPYPQASIPTYCRYWTLFRLNSGKFHFSRPLAGGKGRPTHAERTVCWAKTEDEGLETAVKIWGYSGLPGQLSQELALPQYFQEAAQLVTKETMAKSVVAGPDAEAYHQKIQEYVDAGFEHVYLHQVGPDQAGFLDGRAGPDERGRHPHDSARHSARGPAVGPNQ